MLLYSQNLFVISTITHSKTLRCLHILKYIFLQLCQFSLVCGVQWEKTPSAPVFVVIHLIFLELFLCDSPKSQRQHNNWSLKHRVTADCSDSICFLTPVLSSCRFQSKDIGIQMHEELVKVTNELYTVSNVSPADRSLTPHLFTELSQSSFSSLSSWCFFMFFCIPLS